MNETSPVFNRRPLVYLILGLIVLASVVSNLYWIDVNVVQLGHDASAHLSRTLKTANELTAPNLSAFMRGLTITDFRPPGLYMAAQPFYLLFGRSIDSAQLANIVIMALIVLFTFWLGRRTVNTGVGLLGAALAALLPMMVAVSRLFYTETLVTLCVVAGIFFLLKSDGFTHGGWVLAWGVTLGVGMLAKWTLPVYVVFPTLIVLWPVWRKLFGVPAAPHRLLGSALAAAALAAAVTALIYLPDRARWQQTLLGDGLALAWFVCWFALIWPILLPSTRLTNLVAGLALGAVIAGLWYLPQSRFIFELSDVAFGTGEGDYKPANWGNLGHYYRYFRLFYQHHLGLAIALAILPFGLLPWFWRGRQWLKAFPATLLLWSSALAPFTVLIFTSQTSSRNLVAILPLFAILMGAGLLAFRMPWRAMIAAGWIGVLLAQWSVATFDRLEGVRQASTPLWVGQAYTVAPASGIADPDYWIVPDVLATIRATTPETTTFGILIDMAQLHPGSFEYPIWADRAPIDLASLTGPDLRSIGDVVANQWIIVKDGNNREMKETQRAVAEQILAGAPWFSQLYQPVKDYRFPNGDTAYLYRRSVGPPAPYQFSTIMGEDIPPIADAVRSWWSDHATLAFATGDTAVWLGTQQIPFDNAIIPAGAGDLQPDDLKDVKDTLIVVSRYHTPIFQEWLDERFRYVQEVSSGEFTASLYANPERPLEEWPGDVAWPGFQLAELRSWASLAPGEVLPVELTLEDTAGRGFDGATKLSARLVTPDGNNIAQQDTTAGDGPLELALFVPPGATPGSYTLELLAYDAATLAPVPALDGGTQVALTPVQVAAAP